MTAGAAKPPKSPKSKGARAWQAYHPPSPGDSVQDELLRANLPLVRSIVDRFRISLPATIEVDDLYSVGITGLVAAGRSFDPSNGASFATYAMQRIRGAILDELRRMDWLPRGSRSKARRLQETVLVLEQELGRPATENEVADRLSINGSEYRDLLDEIRPITFVELDASLKDEEGGETNRHETIRDETQPLASELVQNRELIQLVADRIQRMPEMQRKVLAMYYYEDMRLAEIAAVFGLTESRICQIHTQAIINLRSYLEAVMKR